MKSKRHAEFVKFLKRKYPNLKIWQEYNVGSNLFIDIYLPDFNAALEIDGIQHYEYTPFFHGSDHEKGRISFEEGKLRDVKKNVLCQEQSIYLHRWRYDDPRSVEEVWNEMLLKASEFHLELSRIGTKFCQKCNNTPEDPEKDVCKKCELLEWMSKCDAKKQNRENKLNSPWSRKRPKKDKSKAKF